MRFLLVVTLLFSLTLPALAEMPRSTHERRPSPKPPTVEDVESQPQVVPTPPLAAPTQPAAPVPEQSAAPGAEQPAQAIPIPQLIPQVSTTPVAPVTPAGAAATANEPSKSENETKQNRKVKVAVKVQSTVPDKEAKSSPVDETETIKIESVLTKKLDDQNQAPKAGDTLQMLSSLVELQKTLKQQIAIVSKKLKNSRSTSEKLALQEELNNLDKQLNETSVDFERLATGVDSAVFSNQEAAKFSWKDELATLLEPSIKELKQLTARARVKTELKDIITSYQKQSATAEAAVDHISQLMKEANSPQIKTYLGELLPAWQNMAKRIEGKLNLAQQELAKLEANDVSFVQSSSNSIRNFFRERGWYLLMAFAAFIGILIAFRLLARLLSSILPGARKEQRPVHVRFIEIFLQISSVISALCGFILVLYIGEDWFLLSGTIIFVFGLAWTVRQALPKMWQQVRLMLNMGSIREGERVIYQDVPFRVDSINVFCKLHNPALGVHLRIPIESMIGLISRPYDPKEPWFPCQVGDWVAIDGKPNAKVVSLSHELVEVVELGGRKIVYTTANFLGASPANLSTNFFIRVAFGLSYALQNEITTTVLEKLEAYIQQKFEDNGLAEGCLSLSVDFLQAGASSLDVVIFANMEGEHAPSIGKIERSISRWCVECCNQNNWEIPFPQLTVHLPGQSN